MHWEDDFEMYRSSLFVHFPLLGCHHYLKMASHLHFHDFDDWKMRTKQQFRKLWVYLWLL